MPKELGKIGSFLKRIEVDRRIYNKAYKEAIVKEKKARIKSYHKKIKQKAQAKAKKKYGPRKSGTYASKGKKAISITKKIFKELGKYEVKYKPYEPPKF